MIRSYGIDTSILVRLLTGDPPEVFARCKGHLQSLAGAGDMVFASNQVLGEAYIAVQHHYGVAKNDARDGLLSVLRSGLVAPLLGRRVVEVLEERGGCGLLDRLIALDYDQARLVTLTLDERMGRLPTCRLVD